jgi:arginase
MVDPSPGAGLSRDLVLVGVPIDCVGAPAPDHAPFGTELSPAALRAAGVGGALAGEDGGDLDVRLTGRDRDAATGVLGWPAVVEVTDAVRDRVRDLVAGGRLPVVLGGCCTLLPGALAGARDALGPLGRSLGLAYLDGHLDLYDGRTSPTGEPADMPVAVVSGLGPPGWAALVDAPVVAADRLVLLGPRDREEAASLGSALPEQLGIAAELTPTDLRALGPDEAGRRARDRLAASGGRYWVHLDVDVLDEVEFPATDYLMPGGLTLAELAGVLTPLTRSSALAGISLGCYNPQKDDGGRGALALVGLLAQALAAGRPARPDSDT